jgi:hypothetical protein
MSTLGIIDTHVTNALKATTADEKLDEIARAVGELGRFFSNMEDRLRTEIHDVSGNQRSQDRWEHYPHMRYAGERAHNKKCARKVLTQTKALAALPGLNLATPCFEKPAGRRTGIMASGVSLRRRRSHAKMRRTKPISISPT